jgi:hypothetical protein
VRHVGRYRLQELSESFPVEEFFHAFGWRDWEGVESLLHPKLRFRALVPGPENGGELRTALDAAGAVRYLRSWFDGADNFELIKSESFLVGSRLYLSYRLRLHDEDGWQIIEQRMYCDVNDSVIEGLDLLCSGFMPEPQPS